MKTDLIKLVKEDCDLLFINFIVVSIIIKIHL